MSRARAGTLPYSHFRILRQNASRVTDVHQIRACTRSATYRRARSSSSEWISVVASHRCRLTCSLNGERSYARWLPKECPCSEGKLPIHMHLPLSANTGGGLRWRQRLRKQTVTSLFDPPTSSTESNCFN